MKITTERVVKQLYAIDQDTLKGPGSLADEIQTALVGFEQSLLCKELTEQLPARAARIAIGIGIHIGYLLAKEEELSRLVV